MSTGFRERWTHEHLDRKLPAVVLWPRLAKLVNAPLVRKGGGLVLEPLALRATGPEAFEDQTTYEAFVNKIHVEDLSRDWDGAAPDQVGELLAQGAKAAVMLAERLEPEGSFRVLLSLDAEIPTLTLRFFGRREGQGWGADDPDEYALEDVMILDTPARGPMPTAEPESA